MSTTQEEVYTPEKSSTKKQKRRKRNKIASPIDQSPISTPTKKSDVYDLFTIKTPSKNIRSSSQDTSELSDDVFIRQKPVTISSASTKSYRERINERFKNVKEKAGKSSQKANVFKEIAEKILLEKVRRESEDINAELELMRNKLKLGKIPQNHERYEFFCREKQEEAHCNNDNINREKSTDNLNENNADLIFELPKQSRTDLNHFVKECCFVVKRNTVDLENKIGNQELRFLEEEGFYVPKRPQISTRHECFLEQRLSRDNKKWFNCDGKLLINENPTQQLSYRPTIKPFPLDTTTVYVPAKINYDECEEIIVIKENYLHLQINSLKFAHHPLFSLEHVFVQKLISLCKDHDESISSNNLVTLKRRIIGLRQILKKSEETLSQSEDYSDREEAYKRDIKILQKQIFEEGKIEKDRIKLILSTWKSIKQLRETNKYSSTSIKLIIQKETLNFEEDEEEFHNTFEDVYQETLQYKFKTKKREKQELRTKLLEKFKESYRMPGEPILRFIISHENDVTKNPDNTKEVTRRNVVNSTKILLKILCNKVEVCKTKTVFLGDNFTCNFDESITIQLSTIPKFLTIEILEQPKSLLKRTLGELSVKLPLQTSSQLLKQEQKFEKTEVVHYKHEGVGSGLAVKQVDENAEMNTSGYLEYTIKWQTPLTENEASTGMKNSKLFENILDKNGCINLDNLSEWIGQFKPDPQDPRNAILYEYAIEYNQDDISSLTNQQKYFRLNPQMNKWNFCDRAILDENIRLKILQLRNEHEPEFDRMIVPNRIKEIPLDALADYNRRIAKEKEQFMAEDDEEDDRDIDSTRRKGKKYLREIYTKVFQRCKNSEHNLTFEDVINEKFLQHFQKLIKVWIRSFLAWFQWHPKPYLQPTITLPQEPTLSDCDLRGKVKLKIDVISALNLSIPENKDNINVYVQAAYNNTITRTRSCQNAHPVWNEMLIIPLESMLTDYLNPNSLNGIILIDVFNERGNILNKFPEEKSKDWLGSVEVPLSAVCLEGIQGMFCVKTSYFSFNNKQKDRNSTKQKTYLNLNIYIEPNVPKLNPNIEELPCGDLPYIQEYALKWNENFNQSYPHRKFSVFVIDSNATTTCILRYIKPLEPPQINVEGFDVTPEQCARYVSLIPFSDSNEFYKNIWLPVDRFLHFMIGSIYDHAVALTCYFLALKEAAWLLLGFGLPYGNAAFVLVKETDNNTNASYYIYDVVTSEKMLLTEPFCPLQRIYCLVNENNIWANIQRNDDVSTTRFDLSRRSDWLSLFNNKIPAPTNSIHQKIKYIPLANTDELEIILDRKIRKKFAKLRQLDRTLWNHHVSNIFKRALDSFEKVEMYGKTNLEVLEQVKECKTRYEIRGQVLCVPFTDASSLISRMKTLGVHLEEDDSVQFASALSLKPYSNLVVALWIFLASVKEYKHVET